MSLPTLETLPTARRNILLYLKGVRTATISEVADELSISYEAARQQLFQLERDGWVGRRQQERTPSTLGRPSSTYYLTADGEHLFPKAYDLLTVELVDSVVHHYGPEALRKILADLTEARVKQWEPFLEGMTLEEKLSALTSVYLEDDPFMEVEQDEEGYRLVEKNCPFLNVAQERPALCSVTVSTLKRLLGVEVVREERFQEGHGRCAFRLRLDKPVESDQQGFEFEEALAVESSGS